VENNGSSLNLAIQTGNYPAVAEILRSNRWIDLGVYDNYGNNIFHLMMEKHFNKLSGSLTELEESESRLSSKRILTTSKILSMLIEKVSKGFRYLFSQYNNEMLTPLQVAIAHKNKHGFIELLKILREKDLCTKEMLNLPAGYDCLPLINFFGVMFKAHEINDILHENPEINIFQRDIGWMPPALFEYYANNNFDNHRKWVVLKHQNKIISSKFLKPNRSYSKIIKVENKYAKLTIMKNQNESDIHTYADVLRQLRNNNMKEIAIRHSIRHRQLKKVCNRAKLLQKEITHETEIFGDTLQVFSDEENNYFSKKCTDFDDWISEDTTVGGNYPIEHLLNNMKMNPRKKEQIDSSYDNKKSENISTEEEAYVECDTAKKLNFENVEFINNIMRSNKELENDVLR